MISPSSVQLPIWNVFPGQSMYFRVIDVSLTLLSIAWISRKSEKQSSRIEISAYSGLEAGNFVKVLTHSHGAWTNGPRRKHWFGLIWPITAASASSAQVRSGWVGILTMPLGFLTMKPSPQSWQWKMSGASVRGSSIHPQCSKARGWIWLHWKSWIIPASARCCTSQQVIFCRFGNTSSESGNPIILPSPHILHSYEVGLAVGSGWGSSHPHATSDTCWRTEHWSSDISPFAATASYWKHVVLFVPSIIPSGRVITFPLPHTEQINGESEGEAVGTSTKQPHSFWTAVCTFEHWSIAIAPTKPALYTLWQVNIPADVMTILPGNPISWAGPPHTWQIKDSSTSGPTNSCPSAESLVCTTTGVVHPHGSLAIIWICGHASSGIVFALISRTSHLTAWPSGVATTPSKIVTSPPLHIEHWKGTISSSTFKSSSGYKHPQGYLESPWMLVQALWDTFLGFSLRTSHLADFPWRVVTIPCGIVSSPSPHTKHLISSSSVVFSKLESISSKWVSELDMHPHVSLAVAWMLVHVSIEILCALTLRAPHNTSGWSSLIFTTAIKFVIFFPFPQIEQENDSSIIYSSFESFAYDRSKSQAHGSNAEACREEQVFSGMLDLLASSSAQVFCWPRSLVTIPPGFLIKPFPHIEHKEESEFELELIAPLSSPKKLSIVGVLASPGKR